MSAMGMRLVISERESWRQVAADLFLGESLGSVSGDFDKFSMVGVVVGR